MSERRIVWGLFLVAFLSLLLTEKYVGFGRDESVYFWAGEQHGRWFQLLLTSPSEALTDAAITRHFDFNHEHPALMKNLFGISFVVLHEKLGLLRPAAAFRLPAFAISALMLPLIYLLARRLFGRDGQLRTVAAGFAAVSFLLVPRQFFHSHLACFDVPIATFWVLTVYCFVVALENNRWWLWTGLSFGLALAAKHNAYFIPVALLPFVIAHGLIATRTDTEGRRWFFGVLGVFLFAAFLYVVMVAVQGRKVLDTFTLLSPQMGTYLAASSVGVWMTWRLKAINEAAFRAVAPLVAMATLGPLVFYLHWPYLWHHPVDRTAWYLNFHLTHNHYAWFYMGELLRAPPFPLSYVLVKTALTVPLTLGVAMLFGVIPPFALLRWVRDDEPDRDAVIKRALYTWLLMVNAGVSIILISLPNVPHFGGVKHWFPSMPFLAVLAAASLQRGALALAAWWQPRFKFITETRALVALAILLGLPALIATSRDYAYGTSAYGELAGGMPGAASLGMQRQYWANNLSGVLPWINQNARPGERIYFHENHNGQLRDLQRNGMLRTDVTPVGGPEAAEMVVYQYHQEFREAEMNTWQAFGTTRPVYGLYLDETPQIIVYRRQR